MTTKTDARNLVSNLNFCVIDLETTGGNQSRDQIIEIGMVKIKNLKIVDEKSFLINPEIEIPSFIQKLTSIKPSDVKDSPKIEDVIDEILEFISDDIIVAHNISFDLPFLNSVLKRIGKEEIMNKNICTNVMTKHLIPEITSSNLSYMSLLFNIGLSQAHRAQDDAIAAAKLLLSFLEIFIEKDIQKINHLYYPRNKFELDRLHFDKETSNEEILNLMKNHDCPMTLTLKGEGGLIKGVIPVEDVRTDFDEILHIINSVNWTRVTLKLTHPLVDGFFQFSSHFQKMEEETRNQISKFLSKKYETTEDSIKIEQLDFMITNHLIKNQICLYSFLNMTPRSKTTYKIPGQRKKLHNFMKSLVKRFEQKQKGKKQPAIHPEVAPLITSYLNKRKDKEEFLFLSRKHVKEGEASCSNILTDFISNESLEYNFPKNHL